MVVAALGVTSGCRPLPDDVRDYETRCTRMNALPIPRYANDPHEGNKNVYACDVDPGLLRANTRPFPDGTTIVKTSTKEDAAFVWLVATARKHDGQWQWDEYTRNFADEELLRSLSPQSSCTGCHGRVRDDDWIFTSTTNQ